MSFQDSGIFIASSLIADTPEKENAEPGDTPAAKHRSGDGGGSRSARKSLLGRRRSSVGRRLSGFGGFNPNADQSKLASMYKSTIKLSSENKITRDKCWGLHLIDYMDKVIMDEGTHMGGSKVNFQKASCTLDASVKIYSHRVDATHMSSYSLLENLNRTDGDKASGKGGGAMVGSTERSTKLGVHETLKKADQLNQSETERAFKMDPMFHKMSKIFDEAGSRGMLLNNLSVRDGCKVSFDSEAATAPSSSESSGEKVFVTEEDKEGGVKTREGGRGDDGSEGEQTGNVEGGEGEEVGGGGGKKGVAGEGGGGDDDKVEGVVAGGDGEGEAEAAAAAAVCGGMVDVSQLRSTLFGLCTDLSTLTLCPQLQEFRDQIDEVQDTSTPPPPGAYRGGRDDDSDSDGGGGGGFDDHPGDDDASFGGGDSGGGGMLEEGVGDDGDVGGFREVADGSAPVDDVDPFKADTGGCWEPPRASFGAASASFLGGMQGVDSAFGGGGDVGLAMGPAILQDRLCSDLKVVNDDYAFYETGALASAAASGNSWAGASHWKFVGVKKKPVRAKRGQSSEGVEGDVKAEDGVEGEGNGAGKARGKRKLPTIDFDGPPVPESALETPKGRARRRGGKKPRDPTLLSEDYIKRALKAALDGTSNYALPENARFKTKDLGELFLRPGAFTKRWAEAGGVGGGAGMEAGGAGGRADLQGFHDSNNAIGAGSDDLLFADANDGYGGGDEDDDDDDDGGSEGFHFAGGFLDAEGGGAGEGGGGEGVVGADGTFVDNFKGDGLIAADRRVEKISVNYARKAKRVDVRRLKGDLWRKIDAACFTVKPDVDEDLTSRDEATKEEEKDASQELGEEKEERVKPELEAADMAFSDIVLDVASTEEQSGVTVPFYFICLLHLANEKGLKLEGQNDLLDFSVTSDPVKEGSS